MQVECRPVSDAMMALGLFFSLWWVPLASEGDAGGFLFPSNSPIEPSPAQQNDAEHSISVYRHVECRYLPFMSKHALGLIETNGLIGSIVAADAAAKAAAVVVSSAEVTDAAYLTLRIEGELSAVQAAVDAGAHAAQMAGELISITVIPRPDDGLAPILPNVRYNSKYNPDNRPALDSTTSDPEYGFAAVKQPTSAAELDNMTVTELRQLARGIDNLSIKGREISMAGKSQLIDAIKEALKLV